MLAESKYTEEIGDARDSHKSSFVGLLISFWSSPDRPYTKRGSSVTLCSNTCGRFSSDTQNFVVTVP